MKQNIKIRQGIFETNSSSSHSFSMGPEGRFDNTLVMDKNGVIDIDSTLWSGVQKTNDPEIKLSYLLSFAWTITSDSNYKWKKYRDTIYKVVEDFTGATQINFKPIESVDHESLGIIDSRDIVDPEFIKEFVFNSGTWLYLLWDTEVVGEDFYEKPNPTLENLYIIQFNLPGIDKKDSQLSVSYMGATSINSVIYNFLYENFVYDTTKNVFIKRINDNALKTTRFWKYIGNFKFGVVDINNKNNENFIQIDSPIVEIAK